MRRMKISLDLSLSLQGGKEESEIYGAILPHVRDMPGSHPRAALARGGSAPGGERSGRDRGQRCPRKRQLRRSPVQPPHCSTTGSSRSPREPWPPGAPRPPRSTRSPLPQRKSSAGCAHACARAHARVSVHGTRDPPQTHPSLLPEGLPRPCPAALQAAGKPRCPQEGPACAGKGVPVPRSSNRPRLPSQAAPDAGWAGGKGVP